jgi:hypothetical protein
MRWSVSNAKTFRRCQRQWFFKSCLANHKAKDPLRRNAYLLGKLQSIAAWRGNLIDDVITTTVVPALQFGRGPQLDVVLREAKRLFDVRLATARNHPLRQPERSVASWGDAYAAFHCVEYGTGLSDENIATAWREIETALRNLLAMTALFDRIRRAHKLIAQRSLQFSYCGVTVAAVPDLIAFFSGGPPLIVDWKAHITGTSDAWLQLAIYAMALKRCTPHRDFPSLLANCPLHAIELMEIQLLLNRIRVHALDEEDVAEAEAYIADNSNSMLMALDGKKPAELSVDDFPTAAYDGVCEYCAFRKMCWESRR